MFKYVNNMLWFRNLDENRYIGYKSKSNDYYEFIFDELILREFESMLHAAGIDENLIVKTDPDRKAHTLLRYRHTASVFQSVLQWN